MSTANMPSGDGKSKSKGKGKDGTAGNGKGSGENGTILINFVLDKSGSMDVIRDATISGFNEFKNDQARESGDAFFTLTLFDTRFHTVCEAVSVREVPDLDLASYVPDGMTALYDAIGHTMRITDDFVAEHQPDQVLFVVMTDGEENSSREFDRSRIFQLIEDHRTLAQYEFVYLGANQDSYAVGSGMGVAHGHTLDYDASSADTAAKMKQLSHNVRGHRRHGMPQSAEWFSPALEADGVLEPEEWERKKREEGR